MSRTHRPLALVVMLAGAVLLAAAGCGLPGAPTPESAVDASPQVAALAQDPGTPGQEAGRAVAAADPPLDGRAILHEQCIACHRLDELTSESRSREAWELSLAKMQSMGVSLTAAQQAALLEYLAGPGG